MESALTTSPPSSRASARPSALFPAAVGPTTAITRPHARTDNRIDARIDNWIGDRIGDEVHQPVVGRPSAAPSGGGVLAALPLGDQDVESATDLAAVLRQGSLLDQGHQPAVPLLHDLLGHLLS